MSGLVDSRVVEMHFDNSDFQDKIKETIESLERLNEQIDILNNSKSMSGFADNVNSASFDNIESSLGNIENRFSVLGIVGGTIISNLTTSAMQAIGNVSNKLGSIFRQIKQGGLQRAENLEQAKFLLEGLGADVEKILNEDVNYAVDQTAYGLDEAAKVAAIFFASGVKQGDEMKTALRGISGVAAMTGKSYSEVGDVFSDVAGTGHLMTQQLRRLQLTGIAADQYLLKFFNGVNDGSIKASDSVTKSVKEITGGTKTTGEELEKMLRDGVIDFQVFAEAMDSAFGEHAKDANKTFSGSLANVRTALSRLGEAFITPGMQAAIPVLNKIREGISSFTAYLKEDGGMVESFTKSIDKLSKKIVSGFEFLGNSSVIKDAFGELGKTFFNLYKIGTRVLSTIKDAFVEVFNPQISKSIATVIIKFGEFISEFEKAHRNMDGLKNVMVGIFSFMSSVGNIVEGIITVFSKLFGIVFGATKELDGFSDMFASAMSKLNEATGKLTVFEYIADLVERAGKKIHEIFGVIADDVKSFLMSLGKFMTDTQAWSNAMGMVGMGIAGLFVERQFRITKFRINTIREFLNTFTKEGWQFMRFIRTFDPKALSDFMDKLGYSLQAFERETYAKAIKELAYAILALAIGVRLLCDLKPEQLATATGAIVGLLSALTAAVGVLLYLTESMTMYDIKGSLSQMMLLGSVANMMIKVAAALLIMSFAVKMLSGIDIKDLAKGLGAMVVMLIAMLGFTVALSKTTGFLKAGMLSSVSLAMIGIANALLIMSKAVSSLSQLNPKELAKGLGAVVILMGAIFGLTVGVSKLAGLGSASMIAIGTSMVLMAAGINILVPALQKLGAMDLKSLAKGLGAVIIALGAMSAASMFASASGGVGILLVALALSTLSVSIKRLGEMDIKSLAQGLAGLAAALLLLIGAGALIGMFPMIAAGLGALSIAMLSIGVATALVGAGLVMMGAGLVSISSGILALASVGQSSILMLINTFDVLVKYLITLIPKLMAEFAKGFVEFFATLADLAPKMGSSFVKILDVVLKVIKDSHSKIINTFLDVILHMLEAMADRADDFSAAGTELLANFINGIAENIDDVIQAGVNLVVSFIEGLANGIKDNAERVRNAIGDLCLAILEAFASFFGIHSPSTVMEEQGGFLIEGLINGIKHGKIGSAIIGILQKALSGIRNFIKRFKSAGITLIKNLGAGIKSKVSEIKTALGRGISQAVNTVKNYARRFVNAGWSLVSGVASGIRKGLSSVLSAAGSIASKALSKFKEKLKINSPSKVFMAAAKSIPEGVAEGIKRNTSMAVTAAGNMTDKLRTAMSDAVDMAGEYLSTDPDLNPVITPVLDLDNVTKGAGQINSMLGRSYDLAYSVNQNGGLISANAQTNNMLNRLTEAINSIKSDAQSRSANIVNNITVDGASDPEEFANQLIRRMRIQTRM